jgi:hypothetical protein
MSESAVAWSACLLVVAAFLPLSLYRYAFCDDYAYLAGYISRPVNPYLIGHGRVLFGLLGAFLFRVFDTVSGAAALRLIALLQVALVSMLIQRAAVGVGMDAIWAALLAVGFATAPSVQNWMVWGVASSQLPALVLGVAAFFAWRGLLEANGRVSLPHLLWFMLLGFLAMLFYQPFATAAWPLVLLDLLLRREQPLRWRRLAVALGAFGVTLLLVFVFDKALAAAFVPTDGQSRMTTLGLREIPAKLAWFLGQPVMAALSLLAARPVPAAALATAALILLGLILASRSALEFLECLGLVLGCLLLTGLPLLVSPEDPPIRTHVAVTLLAYALFALSLQLAARRVKLPPRAAAAAVLALCLGLAAWSGWIAIRYNALPQARELAAIERALGARSLPEHVPLVLVGLPYGSSLTGRYCDDDVMIGCASSQWRWSLPNMVRLWARARGLDPERYQLLFVQRREDAMAAAFGPDKTVYLPVPADALYLDLGAAALRSASKP